MIDPLYLDEIRVRWDAVRDFEVSILNGSSGNAKLMARRGADQMELRVMRDGDPATDGDVRFIGHAFLDVPRLVGALQSGTTISAADSAQISLRIASASAGPWTAFLESDGGTGGCDVIRVSEDDAESDMYLWMGSGLAPSEIFRFVGEIRQDLPALLAATRP